MKATLVIMAAGMGSRYGGNKQVDGVGPHNEILMEYSIYDAMRAGFGKVVFIIKQDMVELMEGICGGYLRTRTAKDGSPMEVAYAIQDFTSIPDFYTIPAGRTKPFGTIHALLCAAPYVDTPFAVINADDYYGVDAFGVMYEELQRLAPQGRGTMVGFEVAKTASEHGTVSRAICTVENGLLTHIQEALHIALSDDGTITDLDKDLILAPDTTVSMNLWGFTPSIFSNMQDFFDTFLRQEAGDNPKAECLLPNLIDTNMKAGQLQVSMLHSSDRWFGMTYVEDRKLVADSLAALHASGVYPPSLKA